VFGLRCAPRAAWRHGTRDASVRLDRQRCRRTWPSSVALPPPVSRANPASCAVAVYSPGATRTRYAPVWSVEVTPATMPSLVSTIDTPGNGVRAARRRAGDHARRR
jgi:hypothetical protein